MHGNLLCLGFEGKVFPLTFPFIGQAIALTTGMASQDTERETLGLYRNCSGKSSPSIPTSLCPERFG